MNSLSPELPERNLSTFCNAILDMALLKYSSGAAGENDVNPMPLHSYLDITPMIHHLSTFSNALIYFQYF